MIVFQRLEDLDIQWLGEMSSIRDKCEWDNTLLPAIFYKVVCKMAIISIAKEETFCPFRPSFSIFIEVPDSFYLNLIV
jgi:hypothetical protein